MAGSNVNIIPSGKAQSILSATGTGAGDAFILPARDVTLQISNTFSGTVKVQITSDGSNWNDLLETTTTGSWEYSGKAYRIRGNCTVYSSGTIDINMSW